MAGFDFGDDDEDEDSDYPEDTGDDEKVVNLNVLFAEFSMPLAVQRLGSMVSLTTKSS